MDHESELRTLSGKYMREGVGTGHCQAADQERLQRGFEPVDAGEVALYPPNSSSATPVNPTE